MLELVGAEVWVDVCFNEIDDPMLAAKRHLVELLFKFDVLLDGIVVGFRDIAPVASGWEMLADHPYVHKKFAGSFVVLRLDEGVQVPARVTHVSADAVALQVMDVFQGDVDMNDLTRSWRFRDGRWHGQKRASTAAFGAGDMVVVRIVRVLGRSSLVVCCAICGLLGGQVSN